jgi:O-antigen/teichoic acid export membrane protein
MSLGRSLSIYTLSSVVASGMPLLLLPVLTKHMSPADYGVVATLTTLIAFFTPPLMWGIHALCAVEFHRTATDRFPALFSTLLRIPAVTGLLLVASAWLLREPAAHWLQVPPAWLAAAPLFAALTLLPQLMSGLLRMRNQAWTFGAMELSNAVLTVAVTFWLVVGLGLTWSGRMYAAATAGITMSLVTVAWLRRNGYLVPGMDRPALRSALRFGAGVVPHDLFNQVIRLADRLFIVTLVGQASAGQYAVAAQVTSVMLVLLTAFNRAWSPYLFARLPNATDQTRMEIVRKSYQIVGGFAVFFLVFNALVPALYWLLIDPKFHDSQEYVFWLSLGYLFLSLYLTCVDYIFYEKKTHLLSLITFVNMSLNLSLNYVLIGRYGAKGAAMAFACTMFVVMALAFLVSRKLHPMPWFFWMKRSRT